MRTVTANPCLHCSLMHRQAMLVAGGKGFLLKLKKWLLQKDGKWANAPSSIEIFQLLPFVVDQHKAKDHTEVKFSENSITL